ncbi:alpha/beta fold hydrolase [Corynebacterium mendelii]|uniref:Alpha/beta hydrolase n=1 Tax=Corynebacterium mendelii TaxID=2765362 RepID=A0A939IYI5_9CORY|nr:alpha/beta hydrolase [Corynebacterium mendelii]MBN9645158.1 alpha/beta hydrolase [Corynebacterium mendelii]
MAATPDDGSIDIGRHIPVTYTPDLFFTAPSTSCDEDHSLPADSTTPEGRSFAAQVHVVDYGTPGNPAVFLLSGLSVPWFDWQEVAQALSTDHHVVVFDRIGAGLSTATDGLPPGSLLAEVDVLHQVMDACGVDEAHIVGHSMAGFIGEAFALSHPAKTTRLTLLDGSYEPATEGDLDTIRNLWRKTRTPGVVEKIERLGLDIDAARKVFAHAYQLHRPDRRHGNDAHIMVPLAQTKDFIDGMLRELRGYNLWAEELAHIDRALPLNVPTDVVGACRGWANFFGLTLGRWQRKLRRHARSLAERNPGSEVYFIPIQASHMMMRDNSRDIIRIIRGHLGRDSRHRMGPAA